MRRILLTGASGFIGNHLARALAEEGCEVHALVRVRRPDDPRVHCHAVADARECLVPLLQSIEPDVVFHLATHFVAEHRHEDVAGLIESNLLYGTQLLEAMAASGSRRLINVGTTWQHICPDSDEFHASSLYAATKQAFEAIVQFYCEARGLQSATLLLSDSYGPGDRRPKLLNLLLSRKPGDPGLALSPGQQRLALVHVADIVRAFRCAEDLVSTHPVGKYQRYVLGGVPSVSLRGLVERVERLMGFPLGIQWGARPYRSGEVMEPWGSGVPLPGWSPTISLEEGIEQLVKSSREGAAR